LRDILRKKSAGGWQLRSRAILHRPAGDTLEGGEGGERRGLRSSRKTFDLLDDFLTSSCKCNKIALISTCMSEREK
jgi:hypothetical protein